MSDPSRNLDEIRLHGAQVSAYLGVPDEERRLPQTLQVDVVLVPERGFAGIEDEIEHTVNYETVWTRMREVAQERPRKLIETLADEMAMALLRDFPLEAVELEIHKQILPGTRSVSVRIRRQGNAG